MYFQRNGFLPEKYLHMFQQNNQIHSYNTRNAIGPFESRFVEQTFDSLH